MQSDAALRDRLTTPPRLVPSARFSVTCLPVAADDKAFIGGPARAAGRSIPPPGWKGRG